MKGTMQERDQYKVRLNILRGVGSGRASYDKPEILDFILDGNSFNSKDIHSTVSQLFAEHLAES